MNIRPLSWLLLLLLGATWGSSFIIMKLGLRVFTPAQIACLRIGISWAVLLPVVLIRFGRMPARRWPLLLVSGLLGNGIPACMFPLAQTHISSSMTGMLNAMMPLMTLVIGMLFFRLQFTYARLAGIGLGFAGVFCLLAESLTQTPQGYYGLLVMVASLCYALNTHFVKRFLADVSPMEITAFSFTWIGPPAWLFFFGATPHETSFAQPESWGAFGLICILAILGTAVAVIVFNQLLRTEGPLFAASVTYIVPMFATLWGLAFSEPISPLQLVGMGIVLAGIWLVNRTGTLPKSS